MLRVWSADIPEVNTGQQSPTSQNSDPMTPGTDVDPLITDLDHANRDVVDRFFAASERGDLAVLETLVDDQMIMEWPQSGEVFRGRENVLAAMGAIEVKPEFAGQPQLVGSGHLWVLMVPLRYGGDILHYVAVLEVKDGRIRRGTGYWGAPFPPQASRSPFAERD